MNTLAHSARPPAGATAGSLYRRTTPTLLQVVGAAVWAALEAVGHRRARRELDLLARRWAPFDPELAAQLRQAALRELAPQGGRAP